MTIASYTPITPSDTSPQPGLITAILIGGAGNIAIKGQGDAAPVSLVTPVVGKWLDLPHPVIFVMATGTSATNLVGALALDRRQTARSAL